MANNNINKTKQFLINQNVASSKFGNFAQCQTGPCIKNQYNPSFNIGQIDSICEVEILNYHIIDIVEDYCAHGFNSGLKDNWINPVLLCTVGHEFIASNFTKSENIRDEYFTLRTNMNSITRNNNPFPIKNSECTYNRFVTVIRDDKMQIIQDLNNIYRFGLIIASPIFKPKLLSDSEMSSTDFIQTLATIETIFQTAIAGGHNILLLTPFGNTEDEVPPEDIVEIYNMCIFKYGHRFKKIIFGVPLWNGEYLFDLFNKNIVRPQDIVNSNNGNNGDDDNGDDNGYGNGDDSKPINKIKTVKKKLDKMKSLVDKIKKLESK
jgi:hypothetical protein